MLDFVQWNYQHFQSCYTLVNNTDFTPHSKKYIWYDILISSYELVSVFEKV